MKDTFRCSCPITSALDIVGDRWTLVVIKMMLLEGRKTFKDFMEADEQIASSILASRLKDLEKFQLVSKHKLPDNKKTNIYRLTEKGLSLSPLVMDMAVWSDENARVLHPGIITGPELELFKKDREAFLNMLKQQYLEAQAAD